MSKRGIPFPLALRHSGSSHAMRSREMRLRQTTVHCPPPPPPPFMLGWVVQGGLGRVDDGGMPEGTVQSRGTMGYHGTPISIIMYYSTVPR